MPWRMIKNKTIKLTAARKKAGLTIEGLAHLIGVHSRTVVRWERSGRPPRSEDVRARLMAALGVVAP